MEDFVWPSDIDRAEFKEINRVCEYAEQLLDELEALRAQGDAEPVAWWDGDTGEPETAFQFEQDSIYAIPVFTRPPKDKQWLPSEIEYDRAIHHNPDAKAWADFFMQTFPHCGADPDTLHGWFANAMMAVYGHMENSQPAQQGGVPEGSRLVTVKWLKRIHRDLDACQKVIWGNLQDCDPAYYKDAQERLAEIDEILSVAPQPEGAGWVKCRDRLPTKKDADSVGQVWVCLGVPGISESVDLRRPSSVHELYYNDCATHWKPTGLKHPQPPLEQGHE